MAKRVTFSVAAWTPAAPSAVYGLVVDGATWPTWTPIGGFALEREGRHGGESEGAIRVFKTGTIRSREELVELRANKGLAYVARSGLPIRAHRAEITLTPHDGGTTIEWREDFEPTLPGTGRLLGWFLRHFIRRCADGLAARAATTDSTGASPRAPGGVPPRSSPGDRAVGP
jgi:hypothetical protein